MSSLSSGEAPVTRAPIYEYWNKSTKMGAQLVVIGMPTATKQKKNVVNKNVQNFKNVIFRVQFAIISGGFSSKSNTCLYPKQDTDIYIGHLTKETKLNQYH